MKSLKCFSYVFLIIVSNLHAFEMVEIPEITFTRTDKAGNPQEVTVSPFYMNKYDVTINDWAEYLKKSRELDSKWKPNYYYKDYSIDQQVNKWDKGLSCNKLDDYVYLRRFNCRTSL